MDSTPNDMEKSDELLLDESAKLLENVLIKLRIARDKKKQVGGRELSEAITCFETGSMWMNRSTYAEQPYSPIKGRPVMEK